MAEEKFAPDQLPNAELNVEAATEEHDVFYQKDPELWMRQPPKIMRGDMRRAHQIGREADSYKCTCWHKKCIFYGDCRKCLAFHLSLKQIPTCQREMVTEIYLDGTLAANLYLDEKPGEKKE